MKLYDCKDAVNPRRVDIFLAEKGIEIDRVQIEELATGAASLPRFDEEDIPDLDEDFPALDDDLPIKGKE